MSGNNYTQVKNGTKQVIISSPYPDRKEEPVDYENHPGKKHAYSDYTLGYLVENKDQILEESKKAGVPPIAVAMAIGDELQTRSDTPYKLKGHVDTYQDLVAMHLPVPDGTGGDIGPGNIRKGTAKEIRDEEKWNMSDMELQKYILSDEGTAHLAALAMKKVSKTMDPHLDKDNMSDHEYYQHLVEGYREGPQIRMKRRLENQKQLPVLRNTLLGEALNPSEKEKLIKQIENISKPMKTGVPDERSDIRTKQIKWILEGSDTTKYHQEGLMKERNPYSFKKAKAKNAFNVRMAYEKCKYHVETFPKDISASKHLKKLEEQVGLLEGWDIEFPSEQELNKLKKNPEAFNARMKYEKFNNSIINHEKTISENSQVYKVLEIYKKQADQLAREIY